MAAFVLTNARVEINSVNLSSYVRQVRLNAQVDQKEDTAMGAGVHTALPGLKNWSLQVDFKQDYAAAQVDATLWPLFDGGTTFTWKVRPTTGAISATNPEFSATGFITEYPPLGGAVGEMHETSITVVPGGASPAIVRATS